MKRMKRWWRGGDGTGWDDGRAGQSGMREGGELEILVVCAAPTPEKRICEKLVAVLGLFGRG